MAHLQTAPELLAPARWRTVDFISDLHVQASDSATFEAWQRYMASTVADAVFILGDLFDIWVGDDVLDQANNQPNGQAAYPPMGFEARCQQVLAAAAQRLSVYFMPGNRDFLVGNSFVRRCSMTLLADPTTLVFDAQRWLFSHGDALCLGDVDYQQFRTKVRSQAWQQEFLARPLAERQAIARDLRAQSELHKASGVGYADVDTDAAIAWLTAAGAATLIHGHTHQPADHVLDASQTPPLRRLVLSDWCANAHPPRLQVLRLQAGHAPQRIDLPFGH